jgi:hypothetical protein
MAIIVKVKFECLHTNACVFSKKNVNTPIAIAFILPFQFGQYTHKTINCGH